MIRVVFVFLFGFSSVVLQAQYRNQVKFTPFKLINPLYPGIEFYYQRAFSTKYSTQISLAYIDDLYNNISLLPGFRARLEEKYFYDDSVAKFKPYFSVDLMYMHVRYSSTYVYASTDSIYMIK